MPENKFFLDKENTEYLLSNKIATGKKFYFNYSFSGIKKSEFLCNKVKDKKIIHFGCTDHINVIPEKIRKKTFLHSLLTESSSDCVGIDINKETIELLGKNYGIKNIIQFDIFNNDILCLPLEKYDYIVVPDVIEHCGDPLFFLKKIKSIFEKVANNAIFTIPYAFNIKNFSYSFKNLEFINSDHFFWFTPYTFSKLLTVANYKIINIDFVNLDPPLYVLKKFSIFYNTLVIEATFNKEANLC